MATKKPPSFDSSGYTLRGFKVTQKEFETLQKLASEKGSESNALRTGLRLLAKELDIEIDDDVFVDRQEGNNTRGESRKGGKENRQLLTTANNAILAA